MRKTKKQLENEAKEAAYLKMTKAREAEYQKTGIYFMTCLRPKKVISGKDKKQTAVGPINRRCWGWYKKLNDAIQAIEENRLDMHENEFTYAVIEKVPHGVCPIIIDQCRWFIWEGSHEEGHYSKCDKPKWSIGTINWCF